jgi:hypothetical protein
LLKTISLWFIAAFLQANPFPWGPQTSCKLNPARPAGLHSEAYSALSKNGIAHRITQGINNTPLIGAMCITVTAR